MYASIRIPPVSSSSSKKLILLDTPIKENDGSGSAQTPKRNASLAYASKIEEVLLKLPLKYRKTSSTVQSVVHKLWMQLLPSVGTSVQLWSVSKEVRFNMS
jgi:hypothetical protein